MTVHVKICGITRCEDALVAEQAGASAVGFIFYPKSPRYIRPEDAAGISAKLGPFVARVGVFVDECVETICAAVETAGLTAVQLHGSEPPEIRDTLPGVRIIKSFRVGPGFPVAAVQRWPADAVLLDTYKPGVVGGTGESFDWSVAARCGEHARIVLAGGITPENVVDAVATASPWGIDCSSGVESVPGVKDHEKTRALFRALSDGQLL